MKILKSYEEYLEFIFQVNEKEVLNKDNFKNEYYAIIFFGPFTHIPLSFPLLYNIKTHKFQKLMRLSWRLP